MLDLYFKIFLAYAIGSVSGSLVLGRLKSVDIRQLGSGNAGGTNALRTQGFWFALGVVIIDIGKGALAAGWVPFLPWPSDAEPSARLVMACALAGVIGHCFPLWHGFRGGKGAATAVGAIAVLNPWVLVPMLGSWVISLLLTGFVGLATMVAGVSLVPTVLWMDVEGPWLFFAIFLAVFLVFTHRKNVSAMMRGEENRFEKAWLLRPRRRADD